MITRGALVLMAVIGVGLPTGYALRGKSVVEAKEVASVVVVEAKQAKSDEVSRSSGCLIAPRIVLTAAHGVQVGDGIAVKAPYAGNGGKTSIGKSIKIHPKYRRGEFDYDLAIVHLEEAIDVEGGYPSLHDGNLLRLGTPLTVIGRVNNGKVADERLFRTSAEVMAFPGNLNLYGGFPQTVERGDSGGPVFADSKNQRIVAIVTGMLEFSRRDVERDAYLPINRSLREWINAQIAGETKP